MKRYHVLLTLDRTVKAAREKAAGVVAYASQAHEWELHFVKYGLKEKQIRELISTIRPDGAINASPLASKLLGCPVVLTDGESVTKKFNAAFSCDDEAVGRVAADDLIRRGFKQCAYVGSSSRYDVAHSKARYEAFCAEVSRHGINGPVPCIIRDYYASMHERTPDDLVKWLKTLPKPCGLFVFNDFLCQGVMSTCHGQNIRIPEQIGILSVDNEREICEYAQPTLSSIELDFFNAGFAAAKLLDKFMRSKPPKKPVIRHYGIKRIVSRMSTQNVIGSMRIVAAVRERIRKSDGKGISISALAKEFGISTRMLEYRFKNGQGTSIREEIMKARLDAAQRLLSTTTMPIGDVSFAAGFGTPANLRFAFDRYVGTTPGKYRRDHTPR